MAREVKIRRLEDIIENVPEEKLDSFLVDLKNWAIMIMGVKKLAAHLPPGSIRC